MFFRWFFDWFKLSKLFISVLFLSSDKFDAISHRFLSHCYPSQWQYLIGPGKRSFTVALVPTETEIQWDDERNGDGCIYIYMYMFYNERKGVRDRQVVWEREQDDELVSRGRESPVGIGIRIIQRSRSHRTAELHEPSARADPLALFDAPKSPFVAFFFLSSFPIQTDYVKS